MNQIFRPGLLKAEVLGKIKPGKDIVVFDTETTGLKPEENDRIIEFASMSFSVGDDLTLTPIGKADIYIKPPFEVSDTIVDLTGITNEFLADKLEENEPNENGITPVEAIYDILCGAAVCIGHNVGFDVRFVDETMKRYGKQSPFRETADTLKMARDLISKENVPNHKNETLVKALRLTKGIEHFHSAADDVLGTARLLQKLLWAYRDQPDDIQFEPTVLRVISAQRWDKHDMHRVYINTDKGSVYFGENGYIGSKTIDIDRIDRDQFIADVLKVTGVEKIENILDYGKENNID